MVQIEVNQTFVFGGAEHTITEIVGQKVITKRTFHLHGGKTQTTRYPWTRKGVEQIFADPDKYK